MTSRDNVEVYSNDHRPHSKNQKKPKRINDQQHYLHCYLRSLIVEVIDDAVYIIKLMISS